MVIAHVIKPGLDMIAKGLMSFFIALFLVYMSPFVAFAVVAVLGGMYGLIYLLIRKKISRIGIVRIRANTERFKTVGEVFGGIKDVKLLGKEQVYLTHYSRVALKFESVQATLQVLTQMPKFALETIAFGGILLLVISLFVISGEIQNVLPLIALYTFAGYKLMPAIETIFKALAGIRGSIASLDLLYKEIENYKTYKTEGDEDYDHSRIPFKRSLELNNIIFTYKGMDIPVIDKMTLSIKANTTVGFVGPTGCGKTTTIDIILGLLNPQTGKVLVDGVPVVKNNLRSWQNQLGYVPQQIYLLDDTIISNIAFGVPDDKIDMEAVIRAAGIANIQSFIENELPGGYKTVVGERGVRLSGGQRQRIGIARALYYDPAVLVFDEATSALDNITEAAVMDAIDNIMGTKTIIIIAHRLTTVKKCDAIYYMEKGKVIAQGTYDELIESSEEFRRVAGE
jgi:ABC-type bacteriocin/lantibiotic exporter with double-glycine peptidase domain